MDTRERAGVIRRLAGNTIFRIRFTKRSTGEDREMVCRLGCNKGIKGDEGRGAAYDPQDKGLLTVYDIQRDGWRSIPLDAIREITIRGTIYQLDRKEQA